MLRVQTTVIAVVGAKARTLVAAVGSDANARTALPDADADPLDRAVEASREAQRSHAPFLLHDADPLAAVADAFVGYYDEAAPIGDLEVAVAATLQRWRAGTLHLPDHYVVTDPELLEATRRHFYLGYLYDAGPSRVLPAASAPDAVRTVIAGLRAGRWWPPLDTLLDGVGRVVPDKI